MTPNSLENLLRLHDELVSRERIRTDLNEWATDVMLSSGLRPSSHHRFLLNSLDLVTQGRFRRVLVLMPPGSAKSTYASVIFPIWWFIQYPQSSVIAASHTAALVEHFSRRIQTLIDEYSHKIGFSLEADDRSASHWRTTTGGEYFAVGVRGAIAGRRADLVIVDDPMKSLMDADSAKSRQYVWDWYTAELTTRLKPDASIVIVMTRWHEQDLGGQLIAGGSEDWHVLRLPAIAEDRDPVGRPPGAPLWPEWESSEALNKKRTVVGSRIWSALFQQSPRPAMGHIFNIDSIHVIDSEQARLSPSTKIVRAWDLAATPALNSHDPDWTVGLKLSLDASGTYVVEDVVRFRGNYQAVRDVILSTARSDGYSVVISVPIDPGQAGKAQVAQLSALLAGHRIYASREQGSKISRAMLAATQIDAGNFVVRRGAWYQNFIDELSSFPQGMKDDQIDALSRAFITLSDFPKGGRRLFVPFNIR